MCRAKRGKHAWKRERNSDVSRVRAEMGSGKGEVLEVVCIGVGERRGIGLGELKR